MPLSKASKVGTILRAVHHCSESHQSRSSRAARDFLLMMSICRNSSVLRAGLLVTALAGGASRAEAAESMLALGRRLYATKCAKCHGDQGQGVDNEYDSPLAGDASIGELARLITKTMPEGNPKACVGRDARAVAEFVHRSFYSEAARTHNSLPRIGLARLTGPQLRNSLADVYAEFTGVPTPIDQHGLRGEYYTNGKFRSDDRRIDRTDASIDFDFGNDGPGEDVDPKNFGIRWSGALVAPETGRYEIIVRSTCSFMFYLGGYDRTFVDNHVQSGDKTEFKRSIRLLAGRPYVFRFNFQQRKRKTELPPASVSVSWVPPHGIEEIIPARHFIPKMSESAFALQADLPPDDRSYGYERGISVDRGWDEATTLAALEFGDIAATELWPGFKRRHRKEPNENRELLHRFLEEAASTAFRGPLSEETRRLYIDAQLAPEPDDGEAIRRSLLMALKSPRFLYPSLVSDPSPSRRAANRLALVMFDSLPTDWLRRLADNGKLENENQIRAAAKRMVNDYRTRAKLRGMIHAWLNLDGYHDRSKDDDAFPEFQNEVVIDLRASLDAFIHDIVWSDHSDFRQFFDADWTYTTPRLAEFYGREWQPADSAATGLSRSVDGAQQRFGLLTHPYLMTGLAYPDASSPIHRGVFLIRHVLGRVLRPPNEAFTPFSPDLHPNLTTRQRTELQTAETSCQVCHSKINGLGFTLENFDAVGRYRSEERGHPIDASGLYTTRSNKQVTITGPRELAAFLVSHEDAHTAFVDRAFEHFVKQPAAAYGRETLTRLTRSFVSNRFNIQKLIVEIAVTAAMHDSSLPLETAHGRSDNKT